MYPPAAVGPHDLQVDQVNQDALTPERPIHFETYLYYAREQRDKEAAEARGDYPSNSWLSGLFGLDRFGDQDSVVSATEKSSTSDQSAVPAVTPSEYRAASGSLRIATWGTIVYLITTDILDPFTTPFAFAQVGYGPGVACFVVFGMMAAYSGALLWHMFLKLDSDRFPLRSFGDLGYRIYGRWFQFLCNVLQTLQLIFFVSIIILSNGQGLSQTVQFKLCFSLCNVVWMLAGMVLGQIRTLQKFGWVASISVWLNIITMIITMVAAAHTAPNYPVAASVHNVTMGPVHTFAINHQPLEHQLNGIMQIVNTYSGAMIFVEFMAEMRRPMDFWKAMACTQLFVCIVYILFGLFVYLHQGQFVMNPADQGISLYSLQTTVNAISFIADLIAAALYGNIGIKVIYQNVLMELFHAPPLTVNAGKYLFGISVVVYWAIAFIIGSTIPQFTNITSLVAAVCIFQFTYTFPPFMILGYVMQVDAMSQDRPYDPNDPCTSRIDSWRNLSRWTRGYKKHYFFNTWNAVVALVSLAAATLGAYTAIKLIVLRFQTIPSRTPFGCRSPLQPV